MQSIFKTFVGACLIVGSFIGTATLAAPITYEGSINSGDTVFGSIQEGEQDYWSFTANAGDFIVLTGHRLDSELDLAFDLYFGSGDTTLLTYVTGGDDEVPELPGYDGPFADPQVSLVLSSTGTYTIDVWEFISGDISNGDYQLQLTIRPADVPAPAALGLLGLGLIGVGVARRRK